MNPFSDLVEACKRLPANDGRLIGLLPLVERAEAAIPQILAALRFAYAHCDPTPGHENEWRCIVDAMFLLESVEGERITP